MTQTRPFQNAFSSGEIDPLLHARSDFQRYQTGLAKCRGFLPLRQGGVTRAPGTIWRGATKDNAPARMVPFEFSAEDVLTLEFTDELMRVWRYGALVESGGSPYELATPFPEASLPSLQWVQDADVIYITDGQRPIQKLQRLALDSWTIADAAFDSGPFRLSNTDEAVTIQASASTGTVTLTGSGGPFAADMVGQLLLIEPTDILDGPGGSRIFAWSPVEFNTGDYCFNDDKIYYCTDGGVSAVAPTHDEGTRVFRTDASSGMEWQYVSTMKGIVRITAVANANSATATVIEKIPLPCVHNATWNWSEGAWSERWGYPSCLEMYSQRLWAAATPSDPRTIWASTVGDMEDFLPSTEADGAFGYTIAATQTQNTIQWLFRARHGIFVGALGEVLVAYSSSSDTPLGPTTFRADPVATGGASPARPISPYGYPEYIDKGRTRVQEIRTSLNEERGEPVELSLPSQHLGADGFEQIVWTSSPQRMAWLRTGAGELVVSTYDPAQDVLGWAVVPVAGGVVEDMAVSPSLDGRSDILTLVVRREIDGATVRFVEEQAVVFGVLTGGAPIAEAVHFFAAAEFEPDPATDTFSVPHLPDTVVYAWTDRGEHGPLTTDAAGEVVLPVPVTRAVIGLFDATHHFETLDLEAAARDGSSRGRLRRIEDPVGIDMHRTAAGRIRAVERSFGEADHGRGPLDLVPLPVAQDLSAAWSGTVSLDLVSGNCDAVRLRVEPLGGAPLTVTGISPTVEEAGP